MQKKRAGAGRIRWVFLFCLLISSLAYSPAYGDWSSVSPPEVSSDWELFDVHVISTTEGWAVGEDYTNSRGVLLHLLKGVWTSVTPPTVTTDWGLRGVHFISTASTPPTTEGWAVGVGKDTLGKKGVLLHFLNGIWTAVTTLPTVSADWELRGVHFTSATEGWAVGKDSINKQGVLLQFKDGSWTSVLPPEGSDDWDLTSVHFSAAGNGWAVGDDLLNKKGVLLRFTSGAWTFKALPSVSADWGFSTVHFSSASEGWAAGQDLVDNNKGVLLHFSGGLWSKVASLPDVSSDWSIEGIHSLSVDEAWAVGRDSFGKKGVILKLSKDGWKSHDDSSGDSSLPEVSSDWGLSALHFKTSDNGLAVGRDASNAPNRKGVLLKFGHSHISVTPSKIDFHEVGIGGGTGGPFLRKSVTVKNGGNANLKIDLITSPASPFSIETDDCSGKSVAPATSCKIGYRFDPDSAGSFSETSEIHSNDPGNGTVTVTLSGNGVPGDPVSIEISGPDDGDEFTACSLYEPPPFQWDPSELFRSVELQFSADADFSTIPVKAKGKKGVDELLAKSTWWKKILILPEGENTTVYWKVVGKRDDNTFVESIDFSMEMRAAEPVLNPGLSPVSKTALPVISWGNNCAVKFKVWFGNDSVFTKKKTLSFTVKTPNDSEGTFSEPLTAGEWKAIRNLVGDVTGAKVYWYVESWDGLKRYIKTDVMEFQLAE